MNRYVCNRCRNVKPCVITTPMDMPPVPCPFFPSNTKIKAEWVLSYIDEHKVLNCIGKVHE